MQHRSIFWHNTMLLASIIVQLAESTVYSLHWHLSDIQNNYSCPKAAWYGSACSHNLPIYNKWLGPALGSKVKLHYIIEHNVSIIQLPLNHSSYMYISRNCWNSIIQEALGIICQGLKLRKVTMCTYIRFTALPIVLFPQQSGRWVTISPSWVECWTGWVTYWTKFGHY